MQIKTMVSNRISHYSYWKNAFLWVSFENEKPNPVCVTSDGCASIQVFVNRDPVSGQLDDNICQVIIYDPQDKTAEKQETINAMGFGKDFDIQSIIAGGFKTDPRCTLVTEYFE